MAYQFPPGLLPTRTVFSKAMTSRTGGRSITGSQQVVLSGAGFWRASVTLAVGRESHVLSYRALYASMDGMAGELLVPYIDPWRPRNVNGRRINAGSAACIIGGGMHDHSGLGQTENPVIVTAAPAPLGATRISLDHGDSPGLRPGHHFGMGDRLYLAARAWSAEAEGIQIVDFWPKLREPVPSGTPLILGRPVCKMRMASDETGELERGIGRAYANPSIEFEEVY